MVFNLSVNSDNLVQRAFLKGMEGLNSFWGINWQTGLPNIYICDSRIDFDLARGGKSRLDTVAFTRGKDVILLSYEKIPDESSLSLNEEQYAALIGHELCHLFVNIVNGGKKLPLWLNEGLSIYLSGQTEEGVGIWRRPKSFSSFIESDIENKKGAYEEGGFVVELLVKKFGKEKMIELVRKAGNGELNSIFEEVYGFSLSYEEINNFV